MSSRANANPPSTAPPEPRAVGRFDERDGRVDGGRRVAAALFHVVACALGPFLVVIPVGLTIGTVVVLALFATRFVHHAFVRSRMSPRRRSNFTKDHIARALANVGLIVVVFALMWVVGGLLRSFGLALLTLFVGLVVCAFRVCVAVYRACQGRLPDGRRLTTPMPNASIRRARRIAKRAPVRAADPVSTRPV